MANNAPAEVLIDGIRYVPVSQAHISVPALEDAIVSTWAGSGDWRVSYPNALGYLRVIVIDDEEEGEPVPQFLARLLAAAEASKP